jgi:hypothetical protein
MNLRFLRIGNPKHLPYDEYIRELDVSRKQE